MCGIEKEGKELISVFVSSFTSAIIATASAKLGGESGEAETRIGIMRVRLNESGNEQTQTALLSERTLRGSTRFMERFQDKEYSNGKFHLDVDAKYDPLKEVCFYRPRNLPVFRSGRFLVRPRGGQDHFKHFVRKKILLQVPRLGRSRITCACVRAFSLRAPRIKSSRSFPALAMRHVAMGAG